MLATNHFQDIKHYPSHDYGLVSMTNDKTFKLSRWIRNNKIEDQSVCNLNKGWRFINYANYEKLLSFIYNNNFRPPILLMKVFETKGGFYIHKNMFHCPDKMPCVCSVDYLINIIQKSDASIHLDYNTLVISSQNKLTDFNLMKLNKELGKHSVSCDGTHTYRIPTCNLVGDMNKLISYNLNI